MMDIYELSMEACGVLEKGDRISRFLATDLQQLLTLSQDETIYLRRVAGFIQEIRKDQSKYLDEWLLTERFDEAQLKELLLYIGTVQAIPVKSRIFVNVPLQELSE